MIKLHGRSTAEDRNPLNRLRMQMREADPDPVFRAVLRERLVAEAADRSSGRNADRNTERREDYRIPRRTGGHREPVD
ncbi:MULTISPECIES: hypothetical protein [Thermomonosporaceae]|uniref:hypothetical protein n=1 Tax=Thermomonosporaceae TaxID=2012 RepID=UPI00255B1FE0|nr:MULTISPECIES: hypothetical protein [Thermomonosporaceae]MDL4777689.1 hypothetical protein [Actinomadura xylanilytica]